MITIHTTPEEERTVLVGLINASQPENRVKEYLDELAFLVETAGGKEIKRFTQRLDTPDPRTYVGKGKLQEIADYVNRHHIDMVVFDDELGASQIRNIEKTLGCKVLDRTNLILDIFARRARTTYARTQVELAQYQYLLPRLTRMWTHLERQRGGIGLRGPGETELETDRRIIRDKIALLKEKLQAIDRQMITQRKHRDKLVRVALVGYTNVGKSTLMNMLSKADVFAENKLFATLDTTVRKVVIQNLPFLISDTVGFIRKLPHHLVESFKSTLDEVRDADLLLHVVDISHSNYREHIEVVQQTLAELGVAEKPVILVFNKTDAITSENLPEFIEEDDNRSPLEHLKASWLASVSTPCVFISAKYKHNIDELKDLFYQQILEIHMRKWPHKLLF